MVFKKLDFFSALDTSRPRQTIDSQYDTAIMGGREVSRPYRVFSPKASGFYSFGDATALAGEGGVGDVVWLIQAPTTNQRDGSSML